MNLVLETKEYYKSQIENAASKHEEFNSIYAKTLTKFQEMKLFEAFGEAAPQAVLQFAIIIQLGYVSPVQLVTIITSLFSFSLTSAEIFLMMKTKNKLVHYLMDLSPPLPEGHHPRHSFAPIA